MRTGAMWMAGAVLVLAPGAACEAVAASPTAGASPPAAWRTCPDGGIALAGSAGCVRLNGDVEVESTWRTAGRRGTAAPPRASIFSERARGRVAADVRVPTDLGPLRIYTSIRVASPPDAGAANR